jgi:glycosyltransferase involved in cell wall biosynthesis
MADLAHGLTELGHEVFFYPDGRVATVADNELAMDFVMPGRPFSGPDGLMPWLEVNGASLDHVILSRPGPAGRYLPHLVRYPRARRIFFGHDIHHHRLGTGRALGMPVAAGIVRGMAALERHLWRNCDLVVYPSAREAAAVIEREPAAAAIAIPIYRMDTAPLAAGEPLPRRRDALFVGGAAHAPNRDAVEWFAGAVLEPVRKRAPDFALNVVGDWPPSAIAALTRPGLVFHGRIDDAALSDRIRRARMAVVPLRFGAGVKRKVVAALAGGLPVVSTPVGMEGMDAADAPQCDLALIANDAAGIADAILRLAGDDGLWRRLAAAGQDFARACYGRRAYNDGLRRMLEAAAGTARSHREILG